MSLENLRIKYVETPTSVTITSKSGESHKIREIWIDSPASPSYMDIVIGAKTITRIPIASGDALFVAPYNGSINNDSIIALLKNILGEELEFEADEDEDITIKFSGSPGAVHILYEIGKPGIDKTKLGRSNSPVFPLIHILTHSQAISASGNYSLDTPVVPTGFPDLKDGDVIPSGRILSLKAIGFGSQANVGTKPTKLHLWAENFELLSPIDHEGIPVDPDHNFLKVDVNTFDIFKVPQYDYVPGTKLTANFDAVYDGTNTLGAETLQLYLVALWKPAR